MKTAKLASVLSIAVGMLLLAGTAFAQHDPGVRGGPSGAGGPLAGLSSDEVNFFNAAKDRFQEIDSVSGNVAGEAGVGLGPGIAALPAMRSRLSVARARTPLSARCARSIRRSPSRPSTGWRDATR